MNFVGILAGGKGTRMGNSHLPKQFLMLGNKPIIVHTIEQFLICEKVDKIVIAVLKNWMQYTQELIEKYCKDDRIFLIEGGNNRNETILKICEYIKQHFQLEKKDILLTHDAVRPFITQRIIYENIEEAQKYDAVDTVIPATDTIVESKDQTWISKIPLRDQLYQGQTPQTFKIEEFLKLYASIPEEQKNQLTDAAKVYVLNHKKVKLVEGERF